MDKNKKQKVLFICNDFVVKNLHFICKVLVTVRLLMLLLHSLFESDELKAENPAT